MYATLLRAQRLSPRTIECYLEALDLFAVFLARKRYPLEVALIRRQHVADFLAEMEGRGLTPATVHNRYRALRRFFNFAVEELLLQSGPMDRMKPPRLEEKMVRPYTVEQVEAMIASCGLDWVGLRDAAIIYVLYDTGLRAEEALRLRVEDVRENRIIVHGKGSKERVVRLGYQAQLAVERYLLHRPGDSEALWIAGKTRAPLGITGLFQAVRKAGKRAGIPDVNLHRFRHSYAAHYLMGGGDRYDLRQSMGHASDVSTRRYVQFVAQEHALRAHEQYSPGDRLRPPRRPRRT